MNCRHCGTALERTFVDLGCAPPSNAYLTAADLNKPEVYYPLKLKVCTTCWLVQTEDYTGADALFSSDYAYFSSSSSSWLEHAREFVRLITERLALDKSSFVIEIASNDGYLLKNFVAAGIPCLGIEPTASTATAAEKAGVPVLREFFSDAVATRLLNQRKAADLIVGNNVYAHVPDINDFTNGLKRILAPGGTLTLEFPHLLRLLEHVQFDTIYHEHFSYLALSTVIRIFEKAGLQVFDVQELTTHGGSLRIYGCHRENVREVSPAVASILTMEATFGLQSARIYEDFQAKVDLRKDAFIRFLIDQKARGVAVAGYGAAAKGNTLLNYAGIKPDLLPYVCDVAPAKQGKFLPGSRIPIISPQSLRSRHQDIILVLPWNIAHEVVTQLADLRERGVRFATAAPLQFLN